MKVFKTSVDGVDVFPLKNAIDAEFDDWMVMAEAESPFYLLPEGTKSDYLDVEDARNSGFPVVRNRHLHASTTSVMAFPSPTYFFFIGGGRESGEAHFALRGLRDAAREYGYDVHFDQNSQQANDLVMGGKKVAAHGFGDGHINMFASLERDATMYERITLPDSKFEGKLADTVDERIGRLKNPPNAIVDSIIHNATGELGVDSYTEESIPQSVLDRVPTIRDDMTSDEEVFKT